MAALETKLDGLRGRLLRLWLLRSVLSAAAAGLVLLLCLALLDALADLPYLLRLGVSAIAAAAALAWVVRDGIWSVKHSITEDGLALYLEKRYPELKDAFVTALQFQRHGVENPAFNSPQMVQVVLTEAEGIARQIEEGEVLKARRSARLGTLCGMLVALIAAGAAVSPRFARAVPRAVLNIPFEKRTFYRLESPSEAAVRVPRSETVSVRIVPDRADSHRPARATIHHRSAGGAWIVEGMNGFENGAFTWEFEGVAEDFEFRAEADDWESAPCRVTVTERPRIDALVLTVEPPAYTGMPVREVRVRGGDGKSEGGDISALAGTVVSFRGTANKPLRNAAVALGETRTDLAVEGSSFSGRFTVSQSIPYRFEVLDREDLSELQPAQYQIRVVPDLPPQARILFPEDGSLDVTAYAQFPIQAEASDDHGLSRVRLLYCATDAEESWKELHPLASAAAAPGERKFAGVFDFSVERLPGGATPGLSLRYRAEAADFQEPAAVGMSQEYRLRVREESEIQKELAARMENLRQETARVLELQQSVRSQTAGLLDRSADRQSALHVAIAQQDVAKEIGLRSRFLDAKIRWYFRINRLTQSPDNIVRQHMGDIERILEDVAGRYQRLIEERIPAVSAALVEAGKSETPDAKRIEAAHREQAVVAAEIEEILKLLKKGSEIPEIVLAFQKLRDLIRKAAGETAR